MYNENKNKSMTHFYGFFLLGQIEKGGKVEKGERLFSAFRLFDVKIVYFDEFEISSNIFLNATCFRRKTVVVICHLPKFIKITQQFTFSYIFFI